MAIYLWSTLTNGQVIDPFDPATDVLRFDGAIEAANITVTSIAPDSTRFAINGKSVTVHMALFAVTTSNVTFDTTSVLIVGDNTTSTLNDSLPHTLTGGSRLDQLIGGAGDDTLDGGAQRDTMIGGGGDDTYYVNQLDDRVVEAADEGMDTVNLSASSYTLAANVETLVMLAGAVSMRGNVLDNSIYGNAAANVLDGDGGVDVMYGGAGDDRYTVDVADDAAVELAGEGRDTVTSSVSYVLGPNVEDLLFGNISGTASVNGTGNDGNNLLYANAGVNTLNGMGGNDVVYAFGGADVLNGGTGDDELIGGLGADQFDGGAGSDVVRYDKHGSTGLVVNLANPSQNTGEAAGDTFVSIERVFGSAGADVLTGDNLANVLVGQGGSDTLNGLGGDDILYALSHGFLIGGAGSDILVGLAGSSTSVFVYASYSTATSGLVADMLSPAANTGDAAGDSYSQIFGLVGSRFADTLRANNLTNDLAGGDGDDTLDGRGGNDNVQGGRGNDSLQGGDGNDILAGDAGADMLSGGNGNDAARYDKATAGLVANLATPSQNTGDAAGDTYVSIEGLTGSAFNDRLMGDAGANVMKGANGNDTILTGAGADMLEGDAGNDHLEGGSDGDILDGGPGFDYSRYASAPGAVNIDLISPAVNSGDAAGDTYIGIEGLVGSAFNDAIHGNATANDLAGMDGNDLLDGRSGNDNLQGGTGNDTLEGADGNDILAGDGGADMLDGGNGLDLARYDKVTSGIVASLASPVQNTGDAIGDTYLSIEGLMGSAFGDTLIGDNNSNELRGMDGNDGMQGRAGADTLLGGEGNDNLDGGAGGDVLDGGGGFDYARYVNAAAAVVVDLAAPGTNTGDAAGDSYILIEGVAGSAFNDSLFGDAAVNDLAGLDGNDRTEGRAGNDNLQGMNGNDTLDGGAGMDNLNGGAGNDTFVFRRGEAQDDRIVDFAGNGAALGDQFQFVGYGVVGASFTRVDATHWSINSSDGTVHEVIALMNAASVSATDYAFI